MIASFGERATEDLYHGVRSARVRRFPPDVRRAAVRKLDMVHAARALRDLASPPGNRLEALKGKWDRYHSIRINEQWRVVFRWEATDAYEVRVVDYH